MANGNLLGGSMKVGDLVKHVDRKDIGVVTKVLKNQLFRYCICWGNGDTKKYQTDYYLEVVCK